MKKSIILIMALLMTIGIFGIDTKTDLQKMNLQGRVKSMSDDTNSYTFNPAGNYTSQSYDDGWGNTGEITYSYNDKGLLTTNEDKSSIDVLQYGEYRSYNAEGLLIQERLDYIYVETIYKYAYNDKKQLTWKREYSSDSDADLVSAIEYSYDEQGNMSKSSFHNLDMKLITYTEYRYNPAGYVSESSVYLPPREFKNKTLYTYDAGNRVIAEDYYEGNTLKQTKKIAYDEYGNELKNVSTYLPDNIITTLTYTYTYDKQGNWLTKTSAEDGAEFDVEERSIVYYED